MCHLRIFVIARLLNTGVFDSLNEKKNLFAKKTMLKMCIENKIAAILFIAEKKIKN